MHESIVQALNKISVKILAGNAHFHNGFYDTKYHEKKGILISNDGKEYLNITDVKGNYFYLAYKPKANVTPGTQLSESKTTYNYCYECWFVAITEGLDELKLLNNTLNSIGIYFQNITSVNHSIDSVINEELDALNNDTLTNSVLSKLDGKQAIKINFTQCIQFAENDCDIEPCAGCDDGTMIVADFATFNSDSFLVDTLSDGNYRYQCVYSEYNGEPLANGIPMQWRGLDADIRTVPVQVAPFDTIPAHTDGTKLHYDHNWIVFLQSLPIYGKLSFNTSPFHDNYQQTGDPDLEYPTDEIVSEITLGETTLITYGEGFQITWNKAAKWRFIVDFSYELVPGSGYIKAHRIIYSNLGMEIDGAFVHYAYAKTYKP